MPISTREANKEIAKDRYVYGVQHRGYKYRFRAMQFKMRQGNVLGKELTTGEWLHADKIEIAGVQLKVGVVEV